LKTVLTIAGSDSGGGAGVQADLKTFAALGVHGVSVITSLTAQNTRAVEGVFDITPRFIKAQLDALHNDFDIKAAKTGMLSNKDIITTVARNIGDYPLVVDPVMVAESGGRLLAEDAISTLKEMLITKSKLVTPNIPEAEVLSGTKISSIDDMKKACEIISQLGTSVVVKGGHMNATDILYHEGRFYEFKDKKFDFSTHGSGCTFASAITAELAKGKDLINAVKSAKEFITSAMKLSYTPGKGLRVVNPVGRLLRNSEKCTVILELQKAVDMLLEIKGFHMLVPEVGTNIAYAVSNPEGIEDIAAVEGRIVKSGVKVKAVGQVTMGASKHVAKIVLTANKYDGRIRSAINLRYSREILEASRNIGFTVSDFSRREEPEGKSTMEWGTAKAIEKCGAVPDVIYDLGAVGKEPMIRLLGENPAVVIKKVEKILKAMEGG